jgi:hypothetical protein
MPDREHPLKGVLNGICESSGHFADFRVKERKILHPIAIY